MVRTEREPDNRRRKITNLLMLPRPAKRLHNGTGFRRKKLEQTGPAEKERAASVPQREQLARMPEPPLQKEKEQSRLSRAPDHEGGESQGGREWHLGEIERHQNKSIDR